MTAFQTSLFPKRTVAVLVEDIKKLTAEMQELYCLDDIPWCVGYSGGKDSTAVLQLIWNAIVEIKPEKRTKTIHVITTDTMVENPIVSTWVINSLKKMKETAQNLKMPIEPHLLQPEITHTYWVGLIGKGYPAPRHKFRWCTPRLKIDPSNRFIRNVVRSSGETIVVLGTRKAESANRASIMTKREAGRVRDRLSPHPSLPNSLLYTPIEDWQTDEVWLYLMQWQNPWGYSNKDLLAMYQGATADNECPLVVDTSTPSCGSSRFGCWVCTLVDSDKSLSAMIRNDEEKEWLQPLVDLRLELDIQDDRENRDFRRIWGNVQLFERNIDGEISVEPIPGPYKKEWREYLLRRLLEAQVEIRRTAPEDMGDITLISQEELSEIRRIWLEEKHEFDDSLPRIYEEVLGEPFQDLAIASNRLLGTDEWNILEEVCNDDAMHLELMAKLLDTERQYHNMARRVGIYEKLEKCFETSSHSQKEAIENAHKKLDLKNAASDGDVDSIKKNLDSSEQTSDNDVSSVKNETSSKQSSVKQLTWASLKYKSQD
ncbi:MAG: DNA phosphorothioation system sulfurtransferase DndC [Hormoscilla sp. GUM202]|nr:DNA phosphorothioation system sulfurtransferase DndC [Hormoscilla sp. GUM202]